MEIHKILMKQEVQNCLSNFIPSKWLMGQLMDNFENIQEFNNLCKNHHISTLEIDKIIKKRQTQYDKMRQIRNKLEELKNDLNYSNAVENFENEEFFVNWIREYAISPMMHQYAINYICTNRNIEIFILSEDEQEIFNKYKKCTCPIQISNEWYPNIKYSCFHNDSITRIEFQNIVFQYKRYIKGEYIENVKLKNLIDEYAFRKTFS